MSSSKLPQTGLVVAGSFTLGTQILGVAMVAFATAFLLYRYIRKSA